MLIRYVLGLSLVGVRVQYKTLSFNLPQNSLFLFKKFSILGFLGLFPPRFFLC